MLHLIPSFMPVTRIVYSPTISLIDFIVYILSTISFWLGIAPLSILFDIYDRIVSKLATIDHRQRPGRNNIIRRLRTELTSKHI